MQDLKTWDFVIQQFERQIPVMLLVVLESLGSSPGRKGFKMAVTLSDICGSIGGGIMEHKFVELAKDKLRELETGGLVKKQIHNKVAKKDQSGMICSGEQTIFILPIGQPDIDAVVELRQSLMSAKNGGLTIQSGGLSFTDKIPTEDFEFNQLNETDFFYREKTGYKNELFIVGGGHCSLALSKFMREMDFRIHLFDDRPDLNTFHANTFAHNKKIVKSYDELEKFIPSGKNHYVVIMTFGYRTDDQAVRSIIHLDYKYLGVLGSKTKMKQMLEEWKEAGISEDKLATLHSPIGLPINSQSPEEIAISIAAEIIQVKNA